MRKIKNVFLAAVMCGVVLAIAANAHAASSVHNAIGSEAATPSNNWPIFLEDQNNELLMDNDPGVNPGFSVGDYIFGVMEVQGIDLADSPTTPPVPPGKSVTTTFPEGSQTAIGAGTGYNELTAVFGLKLVGVFDSSLTPRAGGVPVAGSANFFVFDAIGAASWSIPTDGLGGAPVTYTLSGPTAGTVFEIWEDPAQNADRTTVLQALGTGVGEGTVVDGIFAGAFGFTSPANVNGGDGPGARAARQFVLSADVSDTSIGTGTFTPDGFPDSLQFNLNLLTGPYFLGYSLEKNDVTGPTDGAFPFGSAFAFEAGADLFGSGALLPGAGGGWAFASDIDSQILMPIPMA